MSTTSVKLPDRLKARVATAAAASGSTAHAFMVTAIEQWTSAAERRAAFVADAVAARKEAHARGKAYPAVEVHRYLRRRAKGMSGRRPNPRSWRD